MHKLIKQLTNLHKIKVDSTIADELTAKNAILYRLIVAFNKEGGKCIEEIKNFTKEWTNLIKKQVTNSLVFTPVVTRTEVKDSSKFKITNYTDITKEENKIQTTSTHFRSIFDADQADWRKIFKEMRYSTDPLALLIKRGIINGEAFDGTVGVGGCQLYPILAQGLNGLLGGDIRNDIDISSFFGTYRAQLFGENGLFLNFINKLGVTFGEENPNLDAHAGSALAQPIVEVNLKSQQYDVLEKSLTSDHTHCVAVKAEAFIEFMLGLEGKGRPQIALGALKGKLTEKLTQLKKEKLDRGNRPSANLGNAKTTIDDINKEIRELNKQALALDIPPILAENDLMNLDINLDEKTIQTELKLAEGENSAIGGHNHETALANQEREKQEAELKQAKPLLNEKNSQLHQYTTANPMVNPYNLQSAKLYQVNGDEHSAIRIKDKKTWQHKKILSQMSTILAEAIQETQKTITNKELLQDKSFLQDVITFAQEHFGVGNVGFDKYLQYSKSKILKQNFNTAKELSRQYQIAAEKHRFLTGRTENLKMPLV